MYLFAVHNFNPRPPHGGRLGFGYRARRQILISIHVPRTGDDVNTATNTTQGDISIHVPRTGDDAATGVPHQLLVLFQSTSPARGTTPSDMVLQSNNRAFQSTSPARGTTKLLQLYLPMLKISIHVPRTGDDSKTVQFFRSLQHVLHYFLPIGSSNPILF